MKRCGPSRRLSFLVLMILCGSSSAAQLAETASGYSRSVAIDALGLVPARLRLREGFHFEAVISVWTTTRRCGQQARRGISNEEEWT